MWTGQQRGGAEHVDWAAEGRSCSCGLGSRGEELSMWTGQHRNGLSMWTGQQRGGAEHVDWAAEGRS